MTDVKAIKTNGSEAVIPSRDVDAFKGGFRGDLLRKGESGYDDARALWNAAIDRSPAVIARCKSSADVVAAVKFAAAQSLPISVRGGGHNITGNAAVDGGVMIDLSLMKGITVDEKNRTAKAEPGLIWAEFDKKTQEYGLATTGGVCSQAGIAGVTLGGGFGWLMRKYGLALDNVISFEIVTADGQLRKVSATENAELFSAVRGSQSNFGVVTSFEYKLHPIGPLVVAGMVAHPLQNGRDVLKFYREFTAKAPEEMSAWAGLMTTPDGHKVVAILGCYAGPVEEGQKAVAALKAYGPPLMDMFQPMPYVNSQAMFDDGYPKGRHNHWKASLLRELSDDAISAIVDGFGQVKSPFSSILIEHLGGAVGRVAEDATAFGGRKAAYDCVIMPAWTDPSESSSHIQWADGIWRGIQSAASGVYVNYLGTEGADRVKAAYGKNYERLASLKQKYDPSNLFRLNQNIEPSR